MDKITLFKFELIVVVAIKKSIHVTKVFGVKMFVESIGWN